MSDNMLREEPQEIEDWNRGMLAMASRAHGIVIFGDRKVAGKMLVAGDGPALAFYRLSSPDGEKPWGIENVECCETMLVFKTRRALDTVRAWLAVADREFEAMEKKAGTP
jgi:hypothetical protein